MNKLMTMFFALGAIGGFGLSQRDSFQSQGTSRTGAPIGEVRTVLVTPADRIGYIAFGVACSAGCIFFLFRARKDDSRR